MEKPVGINLKIDPSVNEICQAANESSKATRSVFYALLFISVLVFIAFWNSRTQNWGVLRLNYLNKMKVEIEDSLKDTTYLRFHIIYKHYLSNNIKLPPENTIDSCALFYSHKFAERTKEVNDLIVHLKQRYKQLNEQWLIQYREIEKNVKRVNIPFIGASFDINDLGIVSGISLSILMIIFLFTLQREYNNLVLSFISITRRYTDNSDKKLFAELGVFEKFVENKTQEEESFLKEINRTRRAHHYNYLSMTEIFNLPILSNKLQRSSTERLSTYIIFFIPVIVQTIVFLNDINTDYLGFPVSQHITLMTLIYDAIFLVNIGFVTFYCFRKKFYFAHLWDDFYNNDYKLIFEEHSENQEIKDNFSQNI